LRREKAVSKSAAAAAATSAARRLALSPSEETSVVANCRSVLAELEASAAACSASRSVSVRGYDSSPFGTWGGSLEPPWPLSPRASLEGGSMGLFRAGRPEERLPSVGALRWRSWERQIREEEGEEEEEEKKKKKKKEEKKGFGIDEVGVEIFGEKVLITNDDDDE